MTRGPATGFAGITATNVYNNRLQPVELYQSTPSGTLFSLCYDYHNGSALTSAHCSFTTSTLGNNGNVFQAINNLTTTRSQIFAYDALNRITSGQSSGTQWARRSRLTLGAISLTKRILQGRPTLKGSTSRPQT